jgi:hypothetical protein
MKRVLAALAVSALCACGGGAASTATPAVAPTGGSAPGPLISQATIWIHPDPITEPDAVTMLNGVGQWPSVASHTAVFGMYTGMVITLGQSALNTAVAQLNADHMSIELEAPSLQATATCGNGVEGFAPSTQSLVAYTTTYLNMLKTAGANVAYMKVDEPYYFGSISNEPGACQWPVAKVAQDVGQFTELVHSIFPNLEVGDVEPVIATAYGTDVTTALSQWHATYASVNGFGFPFYIADTDFSNPQWPAIDKSIEVATHAAGMQFGIIYEGLNQTTDASWAAAVQSQYESYQGSGGNPDFVLFQTWEPNPTHALPETNPLSLTGIVKGYIAATMP